MAEIREHFCDDNTPASRQQACKHYCQVEVRKIENVNEPVLYLWKSMDNVGFVILFCPFCGTPAEDIIRKLYPPLVSVSFHLTFIDIPLKNRICRNCRGTEFRELTNPNLALAICMKCNRIGTLL
jgi:hypothetical protein